MNFMFQFVQAGLDAGALAVCCEAIFQKRSEVKAKDLLLFPVLLVLCIVPRMNFTANERVIATLLTHGSEIVPANSIAGLLFLLFSVLLLNSIFFRWRDNGDVLSGTMAVFSLYLFVRCLCVAVLAVCGASEAGLIPGSRVLTLALVLLLLCTPFYGQIQQLLQTGGVTVGIVSSDIAILLMAALSVLSFHVDRFVSYLWLISVLLLALLLLDSILLFLHRRRMQERKRIHMIEQYAGHRCSRGLCRYIGGGKKRGGSPDRRDCHQSQ